MTVETLRLGCPDMAQPISQFSILNHQFNK